MAKQQYLCDSCHQILSLSDLRRNKRGEVCCHACGSENIIRHLTTYQKFCNYLLVSNFY